MTLVQQTDHADQAKARLIEAFQDKPNFAALLDVMSIQIQELEDVFFALLNERTLDAAIGFQLDGIGSIVGEDRNGRSDADYRTGIQTRILLNTGSGTPQDMIDTTRSIIGAGPTIELTEGPDIAFVQIETNQIAVDGFVASISLQSAKPAGVRLIFIWSETATPFTFDTGPGFELGEFIGAADF